MGSRPVEAGERAAEILDHGRKIARQRGTPAD
jgi:hypothetical protein